MRILLINLLVMISACSQQHQYSPAPAGISYSGSWQFEKHDQGSFQRLLEALNYVPIEPRKLSSTEYRSYNSQHNEDKMLRDLLVGLLTIIPKELFIKQSDKKIAIDFGVAGYHTFNIVEKSEIIIDGFEIIAYAGWQETDLLLRLGDSHYYQLIEKFSLLNKDYLMETIELKIPGRNKPLTHKRYFRRAAESG